VVGRRPWGTPPETRQEGVEDRFVTTDLNTLLTGLYVKIDDYPGKHTRSARPSTLKLLVGAG
jgi:hypothetical protein